MNLHRPARPGVWAALFALSLSAGTAASEPAARLGSVAAQAATGAHATGFDGVVEAVRQSVIAAQVPGAVVQLAVKAGDRVGAGQVLLRIDARAAEQNAVASDAQVQAARATLDVAAKDFERQKQLFQTSFISQAALERAESEFKAQQAQVNAQLAQAGAARTQSGLHVVRAPFAGIVSEVPVSLGDMAMPGRALLTLYDPTALRITAAVPQSALAQWASGQPASVELPGLPGGRERFAPSRVQVLPAVDASTHTAQLRADLPSGLAGVAPGTFARLWLPVSSTGASSGSPAVSVPLASIVRRAELTGLYVLDPAGRPALRQVRLGRTLGDRVEILAGVTAGESVATDPQAAARVR
jgi:RND family efflux transporter MFP subunit